MNQSFKKFLAVYVGVLTVLLASSVFAMQAKSSASLSVNFLDVGQGDATLVQYLGQYQVLVDGGPNGSKLLSELGKVMPPDDKQIEVVVLTHPDRDHLAGLIDVAQSYQIGLFLNNGQNADSEIFAELEKQLEKRNIRSESIAEGSKIKIGDNLKITAFNPDELSGKDDRNDSSVVLRLDYGKNSFLLTGDAETGAEKDMISDGEQIDVDWLKVGHHGSKTATSEEFLDKVTPSHAVISVGKVNSYGHPNQEVLDRLGSKGIQILRTDQQGTIKVECEKLDYQCEILSD